MPNFKSISFKMAVLQGGKQNLPSPCVCYPEDPMWNRVKGKSISSSAKVDLLGITIDNELSFEFHISEMCRKAGSQLNALKPLDSYLPPDVRKAVADSFILSVVPLPVGRWIGR